MFGMFVGAGMVSPAGSVKRFCLTAEVSPGDPRRPQKPYIKNRHM